MEEELRSASGCELAADILRRFGEVRVRVNGVSMMPAVRPGDVIVAQRCRAAELKPGQIALYRRGTGLVAHRVLRMDGGRMISRGDALSCEDSPAEEADIVGRVVLVTRGRRRVDPGLTLLRRVVSGILRRSETCLRVAVLVARCRKRLERSEDKEMAWM